jgi:hypothetical protein
VSTNTIDIAKTARNSARNLVEDIKVEEITITEARIIISLIREAKGWLQSASTMLNPTEIL